MIVGGALLWVGFNIWGEIFSKTPCERAQAYLKKAQAEEEQAFSQASSDGYRFTEGATRPVTRAIQTRMYAQPDAAKACYP